MEFIGIPTKHCLIASSQNYAAVSHDGHTLFLKDNKSIRRFFYFQPKLIKLFFSPRGQSLYAIDKKLNIHHIQTTNKNMATNPKFELLISLATHCAKFIHVIPYEKVLYLFQDSVVHVVRDNEIISSHDFRIPFTSLCSISRETALSMEIIEPANPVPSVVLVGDESGQVSRILFPDKLIPLKKISSPFVSHSDPISHIYMDNYCNKSICNNDNNIKDKSNNNNSNNNYSNNNGNKGAIVICGKYGTFYSTLEKEGVIPHPIDSVYLSENSLLFVNGGRLFVTTLLNPSAFQAVSTFPAKIGCSSGPLALTSSGMLISLTSMSSNPMNPRPQFIEYALNELCDISNEAASLEQKIMKSESKLNDFQLFHSLKSGVNVLESCTMNVTNTISPNGKVTAILNVFLKPKFGFLTRGTSLVLHLKFLSCQQLSEIVTLPSVQTADVTWSRELKIVSPSPIMVDLLIYHEYDIYLLKSSLFDLFDFSAIIDSNCVEIGKTSPMHSIVGPKPPFSIQFKLSNEVPQILREPCALVSPYGEHWTVRVDSNLCFVSAGTESTAVAVRAAVLRRTKVDGETSHNLFSDNYTTVQNSGFELAEILEQGSLPTGELSQKVIELHALSNQWIDSLS